MNALVRDYANPSTADRFFPVSRAFDWYHGHSWAHGLYESYDGKNQESSSEDSLSAYAIKMWGRTIGDANMQARGNLQLAINARAIKTYYLYEGNNAVQPSNYIGNRCAGILFENKLHHTTFFGSNLEFIQGIHMLPLLPSSTLTRTKRFVAQEWEDFYSRGRVDQVAGGWRGVLYANLALTNPQASWNFFSQPNFDPGWIDGGASRTWYLAYAAGMYLGVDVGSDADLSRTWCCPVVVVSWMKLRRFTAISIDLQRIHVEQVKESMNAWVR